MSGDLLKRCAHLILLLILTLILTLDVRLLMTGAILLCKGKANFSTAWNSSHKEMYDSVYLLMSFRSFWSVTESYAILLTYKGYRWV